MRIIGRYSGKLLPKAGLVQPPGETSFELSCSLIPLSQALSFIVFLLVLSTLSWLLGSWSGPLGFISILLQWLLVPLLIGTAMKLRVRISASRIAAISRLHKHSLFNRSSRCWSDLHSVRLRKLKSAGAILERIQLSKQSRLSRPSLSSSIVRFLGRGWTQQGFLIMDFRSGGLAAFPLAGFSPRALEDFFLALSRFADPMTLNPDVIALQRDILTGQELKLDDTYTRMWEESLRERFEVTNFVPLMGGQELRGGDLTILMLLACGGMSSVYLARNAAGDRLVIKEMAVPESADDAALKKIHEMFEREALILAKLDHPNIVRVLDQFVENSRDYLVLEFIPGLTLRQQVQMHGAFGEPDVIEITKQLADILSYMHGFTPPIIHRDLTPDNLVIREPDKNITLIDFGAANEFIGSVTGTLIGKQCYIPPEQFRGQAVPQSDYYALGATLHFLLTGQDPEPISPSHPKDLIPVVSSKLDNIVSRLTAAEPENRIQSSDELLQLLECNEPPPAEAEKK